LGLRELFGFVLESVPATNSVCRTSGLGGGVNGENSVNPDIPRSR